MIKKILVVLAFALISLEISAQVTVTLGSVSNVNAGETVAIPVTVTGLDEANGGIPVLAAEFHIFYDELNVLYDTTLNFSAITPPSEWIYGSSDNEYGTTWIDDNILPVSFPDNTVLFEVIFNYKGGIAHLDLDSSRCYLVDANYSNILVDRVVDGVITPSQGSEQSVWNGEGEWTTAANWSNGVPGSGTLAVIQSGNVSIASNGSCKNLSVNPTTSVVVLPGYALTVEENIVNDGSFTIESDLSNTGSVIVNGSFTGNGNYLARQAINFSEVENHLVSSPLVSTNADVYSGLQAVQFNEANGQWQAISSGELLDIGKGIRISSSGSNTTLQFQGLFNSGNASFNLNYTASGSNSLKGLNLIGNPFTSAIQADLRSWSKSGTGNSVYVWDDYRYKFWNGITGNLENGIIPSMQGFFVRADQTGAQLEIPAIARLHSNIPFYKNQQEDLQNHLVISFLKKDDTGHPDEAYVHVTEGSSDTYTSDSDVIKLFSGSSYPEISLLSEDNIELALNSQPDFQQSIPVVMKAKVAGEYSLTFSGIESLSPDIPLYLEDTQDANTIWNLRNTPSVSFTFGENVNTAGRYRLHFSVVGIHELPEGKIEIKVLNNTIKISSLNRITVDKLDITSLSGQRIASFGKLSLPAEIPTGNIAPGVYIVRIAAPTGIFSDKILVY